MTRNEFIAETAAIRRNDYSINSVVVSDAIALADALEAANVAPWQDDKPAMSEAAMAVVEAAIAFDDAKPDLYTRLAAAVRAYKDSIK